ncbi:MAG: Transcription elongation factor [Myxococcaceae bacterium]|nr:Transcription elongation factor [Myxococcaceae bacterium]
MQFPDKRRVLDKLIEAMSATLSQMAHAAEEVRRDATHEEAKPENDKDTRALEQSYLARGQAIRAEALVEELKVLQTMVLPKFGPDDPIRSGALIALEEEQATRCVFLSPYGGGTGFEVAGTMVMVVTPVSALGRALLGRRVGDDIEVKVRTTSRAYSVAAIA